jgi:hypothetical protein
MPDEPSDPQQPAPEPSVPSAAPDTGLESPAAEPFPFASPSVDLVEKADKGDYERR